MTTPYPISLKEFKAWKVKHEVHQLLRCDDPRVKARGIVCLDCDDWCKVLFTEFDKDENLTAWSKQQTDHARCRAEDFRWERAPGPVDVRCRLDMARKLLILNVEYLVHKFLKLLRVKVIPFMAVTTTTKQGRRSLRRYT